jgi:hypothetical protein
MSKENHDDDTPEPIADFAAARAARQALLATQQETADHERQIVLSKLAAATGFASVAELQDWIARQRAAELVRSIAGDMPTAEALEAFKAQADAILHRLIGDRSVNPDWIANAALLELDPDPENKSPPLVRFACLSWLKNRLKELLGTAYAEDAIDADEGKSPDQLRAEAEALLAHADQLAAYGKSRRSRTYQGHVIVNVESAPDFEMNFATDSLDQFVQDVLAKLPAATSVVLGFAVGEAGRGALARAGAEALIVEKAHELGIELCDSSKP